MRFVRDPLVHFVLMGLVLLALYRLFAPTPLTATSQPPIELGEPAARALFEAHRERTGGWPDEESQKAIVDAWLREEVLAYEARRLGLDGSDRVVKRRLAQLGELLVRERVSLADPTPDELSSYYDAHASRYQLPARVSFDHVFLDRDRHTDVDAVATTVLAELVTGADHLTLGDAFARERTVTRRALDRTLRDFGGDFSRLGTLPLDEWSGPLASSYGVHLVRIGERLPPSTPPLAEIRERVVADWRSDRRDGLVTSAIDDLVESHDVVLPGALAP